jgi:two-component system phosphate regulon response regulator OmpR
VRKVCRALIVEDDPAVQQIFGIVLAEAGYDFALAHDGASMRAAFGTGAVDVMIIDVMLPGGESGIALAKEAAARGCGIILVTGHHDHYQGVEESGYRYLLKPFRMTALLDVVEQVLREAEASGAAGSLKHGE